MVSPENVALWVVVAVALAELLKNVVYEPVVLGDAVKLHPIVALARAFTVVLIDGATVLSLDLALLLDVEAEVLERATSPDSRAAHAFLDLWTDAARRAGACRSRFSRP